MSCTVIPKFSVPHARSAVTATPSGMPVATARHARQTVQIAIDLLRVEGLVVDERRSAFLSPECLVCP